MANNETKQKSYHLATSTILLTASKATATLNIILIFILLSYLFTTEAYGSFRQVWLLNKGLSLEVFALGIPMTIYYFLPKLESNKKKNFVIQTILLLFFLGICATATIYFASDKIAHFFSNPQLGGYLRHFSLYPTFFLPTLALEGISIVLKRSLLFSVYTIIDRFCLLIIISFTIFLSKRVETLCTVFVIFAFFEFIAANFLSLYLIKNYKSGPIKLNITKQLRFSIPTGLGNIVGILNIELDKIVVSSFLSVTQFAKYVNGAFEVPFIGIIASSVSSVMMPEYVKCNEKKDFIGLLQLWHRTVCKVAIFFLPVAVYLFIFSSEVITLLFSSKYTESVIIFQIYLVAILPQVTWYGTILLSMGHSKDPFYASILALVSNISLNYLFIQWIGFQGPAIATVITTYILAIFYLYRIKTVTRTNFKNVFPWKPLIKILCLSVLLGILILPFFSYFIESRIIKLGVAGIFYFSLLLYIFYRLNILKDEDLEFAKISLIKIINIVRK